MGTRVGPSVRLVLSCDGCMYERTEKYVAQGDSGREVSCARFDPPTYIGDTTWSTPDWCPLRTAAIEEHLAGLAAAQKGDLHVWTADSEDWVVAESAAQARDLFCAQMGLDAATGPEPDDDREFGTHSSHWEPLPDAKVLTMCEECPEHHKPGVACPRGCDEKHVVHHTKTCAEWAAGGAAYLGSANW